MWGVSGWTEEVTIKAIILGMRGKALSWASQTLSGRTKGIRLEELKDLLKRRFGGQRNNDITLGNFVNRGIPNASEECSLLLK